MRVTALTAADESFSHRHPPSFEFPCPPYIPMIHRNCSGGAWQTGNDIRRRGSHL